MTQQAYELAVSLIDNANSQDPNTQLCEGKSWPKELLYGYRMANMLERFRPDADHVVKLAIRGQHIQRWQSPRSDYPMNREGYHKWRSDLYIFHADKVAELMAQAGFSQGDIERAKQAVAKVGIKVNPDTQLLEDIVGLVFIEHYMLEFAAKHPEYSEQKWLDIIRKTWHKMSTPAHEFALAGHINIPQSLAPLIHEALQG
ncbi:MAG: hypothetical protein ACJA13_001177 [Paraglaciecola sp.]|jgi:hypothetical protein